MAAALPQLDMLGKRYDHETPWCDKFLKEPKAYLKRVDIGAIGRINTTVDVIKLAVTTGSPAKSRHFTSTGLYYLFRYARQARRQLLYTKDLEKWCNTIAANRGSAHLFMNYSQEGYYG